jgi:hypothetical protein
MQHTERPPELGDLEISITPAEPLTLEDVKRFADLGVHRLIVMPLHQMPELFNAVTRAWLTDHPLPAGLIPLQ